MKRRLFVGVLLATLGAAAQERVIEAGRERELLALLSPYELAAEVTPGWKLWNVAIGARAVELELVGPAGAKARLTLAERGDAAEHSASFDVTRDVGAEQAGRAAADALLDALKKNDPGGFWHARPAAVPAPAGEPPAPARGLVWPLGVGALSIAAMWWLSRRR